MAACSPNDGGINGRQMSDLKRRAWRQTVLFAPALAVLLIAPAGSLRFWQGWLYGFVFMAATTAIGTYFLKHDPKLVERRMKIGPMAEQEPAQKIIMAIVSIGFVFLWIIPGLDYRWQWSAVPPWLVVAADGLVVVSFAIMFVVLKQNSYAASTIKVEAGQPVVSTGYLRHCAASDVCRCVDLGEIHAARARLVLGAACAHPNLPGPRLAHSRRGTLSDAQLAGLRGILRTRSLSTHPGRLVSRGARTSPTSAPSPPFSDSLSALPLYLRIDKIESLEFPDDSGRHHQAREPFLVGPVIPRTRALRACWFAGSCPHRPPCSRPRACARRRRSWKISSAWPARRCGRGSGDAAPRARR